MIDFLNKPYLLTPRNSFWKHALGIGVFVFLFLLIFQPFQLSELPIKKLAVSTLGYGLISFLVTMIIGHILPVVFPKFYSEDSWTIGKEMLSIILMVICIAIANYCYTVWMNFMIFNLAGFLMMLVFTFSIGIFVVIGMVSFDANRKLKKNLKEAHQMNARLQKSNNEADASLEKSIDLFSEVEKQNFSIASSKLVYLTSVGNYIDCFYLSKDDKLTSARIRNRMKVIETVLFDYPMFFRCHRAFIVNQDFIKSVNGNAKGYTLNMRAVEMAIPVARSKSIELKKIIDTGSGIQ